MILIIDANIIISALLRNSKTREILTNSDNKFYSPDTLLESIQKYKLDIINKSKLSEKDFETILEYILRKIKIIKKEEYSSQMDKAQKIMEKIDIDDSPYIALALTIYNDGIWTDDLHFKKQKEIETYSTPELISLCQDCWRR